VLVRILKLLACCFAFALVAQPALEVKEIVNAAFSPATLHTNPDRNAMSMCTFLARTMVVFSRDACAVCEFLRPEDRFGEEFLPSSFEHWFVLGFYAQTANNMALFA
jgi:hypothetical protein